MPQENRLPSETPQIGTKWGVISPKFVPKQQKLGEVGFLEPRHVYQNPIFTDN